MLGTTTANGEVAATRDARVGPQSVMSAVTLEQPLTGSREALPDQNPQHATYLFPGMLRAENNLHSLRFVGYMGKTGPTTSDRVMLSDLYDALLFVKLSHIPIKLD